MSRHLKEEERGGAERSRIGDNLLPYADTLHYPDCGCPPGWQNNTRAADLVDLLAQQAFKGYQAGRLVATRPLRVLYFLPHHNVTGGMKCLVEHIRLLKVRGKVVLHFQMFCLRMSTSPRWFNCL